MFLPPDSPNFAHTKAHTHIHMRLFYDKGKLSIEAIPKPQGLLRDKLFTNGGNEHPAIVLCTPRGIVNFHLYLDGVSEDKALAVISKITRKLWRFIGY